METHHGPSPTGSVGPAASALRDQLAKLQALVGLSMVMTDRSDVGEIVKLASESVSSLAPVRCAGVFAADRGWLKASGSCSRREVRLSVEKQLRGLRGQWGGIEVADEPWAWALPMRSLEGASGHLVIVGEKPVDDSEQFLFRVLAQQLGIAIANADIHARERATAEELETVNLRLERSIAIHDRLTRATVEGRGMDGIAEILHELTGHPVVIDDPHGRRLASSGLGPTDADYQVIDQPALSEFASKEGSSFRLGRRLATVCGNPGEFSAVLSLLDPDHTAGDEERIALEHGATVLALELSRLKSVLEAETRLGGELLEEMLLGIDDDRARMRAGILGYDLGSQQRVGVISYDESPSDALLFHAVRRVTQSMGVRPLLGSRRDGVVVVSEPSLSWSSLRSEIDRELGQSGCRVGVSGICDQVAEIPRAYREAQLALEFIKSGHQGSSFVSFEALGVFEILADTKDPDTVQRFMRTWLGALLDHDEMRDAQLVRTLSTYLEAGQSYEQAAQALDVHRNTLRYRLKRIGEISGYDLGDPDVRFNLQLACRAWRTLAAIQNVEMGSRRSRSATREL